MVNTCVSYVLCRVVILVYVAVLLRGLRHVTRTVQDAPRTIGTTSQQTETQEQTIDYMNHSRRVGSRQHVQANHRQYESFAACGIETTCASEANDAR